MNEKIEITSADINKKIRYLSIDVFRGLAITVMLFVNTVSQFNKTPSWSKHATDFGLTYVDLVAPFFIFAIALTYKMSYDSSLETKGYQETILKFLRRYGAFIGFGTLGAIIITPTGMYFNWGVLQAIGLAGIIAAFFVRIPRSYRLIIGFLMLEVYQFIIGITVNIDDTLLTISDLGYYGDHGGLIGSFGYGVMLILGISIVDDFRKIDKMEILIFGLIFIILGTLFHYIWVYIGFPAYGGLSKMRVTHSYTLLTTGLAACIFWLIWFIFDYHKATKNKSYFLQPQGKNAFFLFVIQPIFLILSIVYLNKDAHVGLVFMSGIINVFVIWAISIFMDKRKIYLII